MNETSSTTGTILRYLLLAGFFTLVLAASLFISSGRLDWVWAWTYLGVFVAGQGVIGLILVPNNPDLVMERAKMGRNTKSWDRPLSGLVSLYGPVGMLIIAGLDVRFGWLPQIPLTLQVIALGIVVLGTLLTTWAMGSNKFFYGFVRIEKDRGHTVATGGPYQYVRHPGYLGGILADLATPVMLGSLWALIPAALTVCIFVVRTTLEDRTLQDELDGYKDYARKVRYRLLPGIW